MQNKNKDIFYKYTVTLQWPQIARNRSIETLRDRPDIMQEMNHFMQKVENVTKLILKKLWKELYLQWQMMDMMKAIFRIF